MSLKAPSLRRSTPLLPLEATPAREAVVGAPDTIEVALPTCAISRFVAALASSDHDAQPAGARPTRFDAPSVGTVERVLRSALADADATGTPRVLHSKPGLYAPEYWRIVVLGADPVAVGLVTRAVRGTS
ncbi:MAG: hypothetical protein AABZ33_06705 [Chloroflexota bacterium]